MRHLYSADPASDEVDSSLDLAAAAAEDAAAADFAPFPFTAFDRFLFSGLAIGFVRPSSAKKEEKVYVFLAVRQAILYWYFANYIFNQAA